MTQAVFDPIAWHESWDYVKLAGQKFPFPCVVTGFARKYDWDKKPAKGQKGGSSTFTAQPLTEGQIEFKLWLPSHFENWLVYVKLLKYDPLKKDVKAISISHPVTMLADVASVVTEEIGPPVKGNGLIYTATVKFSEYGPPPKKDASKTASGTDVNGNKKTQRIPPDPPGNTDDPISKANQAKIDALLKKAKEP